MALNVDHLLRTAATLEQALLAIGRTAADDAVMFDLFRNAAIKSFELSLETAGGFANVTLKLLPAYLHDVRALAAPLQRVFDAAA